MAETKRMTAEQVVGYLREGEGVDPLRESLSWVVQQLMEAEVSELVGAARGERAPEQRLTHRNGYRSRAWSTRAGELELAIPKLRRGSSFPSFLEPRKRSEQALVSVVQKAYVAGVSTRKVDQVVESLGLRISKRARSPGSARGWTSRSTPSATGRWRAATRTCGSTPRSRRSETAAGSCARRSCSPTACTSPATGR
jgi:transposase-like protein